MSSSRSTTLKQELKTAQLWLKQNVSALGLLFRALSGFYASMFRMKHQIGVLCRSMPHKYHYGDYMRQSAGMAGRSSAAVTRLLRSCVGRPLVQQEPGS